MTRDEFMSVFVEVDHIDQAFPLPNGGTYVALKTLILKSEKESSFF